MVFFILLNLFGWLPLSYPTQVLICLILFVSSYYSILFFVNDVFWPLDKIYSYVHHCTEVILKKLRNNWYVGKLSSLWWSQQNFGINWYVKWAKIYWCVNSFDDYLRMYKDIKCIEGWLSAWQLRINLSKCEVLHVGWNNLGFSYRIHNDLVSEPGYCKDLGVYISENLSTTKHCSLISRRAYYRMRQFFRTFTLRDRDFCIFLYCTYIRPLVESNTTIFYPSLIQDIDCVERVQRRFTKRLPGVSHLGYLERLRILGLDSLEVRRIHHDLILLFKIINNLIDIPFSCMFSYNLNPTRGHCLKLNTPSFRLNCRKNFFSVRICKLWNNLPERIVIINSLKVFKQEIIKVDFTSYCKGRAYTA